MRDECSKTVNRLKVAVNAIAVKIVSTFKFRFNFFLLNHNLGVPGINPSEDTHILLVLTLMVLLMFYLSQKHYVLGKFRKNLIKF